MDEEKNILVSVSSEGVRGNVYSLYPSISADGRYVIFWSNSNNLVSVDTNTGDDIFVRDLVNGTTTLVSVNSEGIQENASYYSPNISADGRYVSFFSISAEQNGINTEFSSNIFVRDLVNGTTTSFPVSSSSMGHTMSADGRYIAYETLKPGSNISEEIFIRDLVTGTTELVSISSEGVKGNGFSVFPGMSTDGRYVTFSSAADNLVNGDTNKNNDVYVRDLVSGTTELVSISSEGVQGNNYSNFSSISADGRYVAFSSGADNLVNDDTNKTDDVFVRDLVSGTTELVSISSEGVQGNGSSFSPSMSADGRYVAFESNANNLVSDDTNDNQDIFVRDLVNGTTTRIPILSKDLDGFALLDTTISADGRYVAFHSYGDIFVRDLQRLGATGGVPGGDTGGSTGGDTGGVPGGDTGGSTGGDTGGSTGGDTGGSTGGDTGGVPGGDTGGSTDTNEDLHTIYEFIAKDIAYKDFQVDKTIDYGYQVNEVFEDESTGFYALGLTSTSGKSPVLAIRGTEIQNDYFADIFSDINPEGIGFDQFTPNVETVSNWLSKQTNPDIVGHSLGGALSQYFASDFTNKGGKLGEVVTFNSPGISTEYSNKFNPDNVTEVNHYIASGDIVSLGGEQFIDGNYSLASFSDINLLNKHLLPLLSEAVGYDQEEKGSKRPGNVTIKSFSSVDFLNSNFFTYTDKDYWNWILRGIAVTQSVNKFETIPPLLIFRNTVESSRKTIGNGIDLISDAITRERIASNDFIPIPKTEFNLLGLLDIQAEDLSLEYKSQPQDTFRLQGKVSIPKFYNATGDFAGGNYIQINQDGVEVVGELSVEDIVLVPKIWGIKEAKLAFDTVNNEVQGEGSILIPSGIIIGGGLGFVNNEFNFVSLEVDNLNKPIATTGLFLQRISGQVDNIAELNLNPIEFGGGIGVTGGAKIDLPLPGWLGGKLSGSLVELDVDGTLDRNKIKADGEVRILGGLVKGNGSTELNWNEDFLSSDFKFNIANFIDGSSKFRTDSNLNIHMSGEATIKAPEFNLNTGFFGKKINLGGFDLASGQFVVQFTNDDNFSDDYVRGSGSLDLPLVGKQEAKIQVYLDGKVEASVGNFLIETSSYTIAPETEWIILNANWENSSDNATVNITKPDGTIINESEFQDNNIAIVDEMVTDTTRAVIVKEPEPGIWDINLVDTTGLGEFAYTAFGDSTAPTIEITSLVTNESDSEVTINYDAFDVDSDAKISLFYDNNNQGTDGIIIETDLAETDGNGSYTWNTQGVAPDDYHVYAMVVDDNNAAVFDYSSESIEVKNSADLVVNTKVNAESVEVGKSFQYIIQVTNNGSIESEGIKLTETLPPEATFVSASETPINQSENILEFNLGNLAAGETKTVEVTVTAPNSTGIISSRSQIESDTFDPDKNNNVDINDLSIVATKNVPDVKEESAQAPTINNAIFSVDENSDNETQVAIIDASDSDNEALTFAIASGNLDPDKDGKLAFNLNSSSGAITVNDRDDLDFEITPNFNLEVTATDANGLSDTAQITINLNDVSSAQFDISQSQNGIFTLDGGDSTNIKFTLANSNTENVNEVGVFVVDDENGNINGLAPGSEGYLKAALQRAQVVFSAISNRPSGFDLGDIERVFEVEGNTRLGFYLVSDGTTDTALAQLQASGTTNLPVFFSNSSNLQVAEVLAEGFNLNWSDKAGGSDFTSMGLNVQLTQETPDSSTKLQREARKELIDLSDVTGQVSVSVEVHREAAFDSLVGFYQVIDSNGGIDINGDGVADINPGNTGYKEAALSNRVAGLDLLKTDNQQTNIKNGTFGGGSILASFMVVDGTVDEALNNNSEVYFSYLGANSDGVDHIRLLGDNTFGFEDLAGGGDFDYNDMIVKVNLPSS